MGLRRRWMARRARHRRNQLPDADRGRHVNRRARGPSDHVPTRCPVSSFEDRSRRGMIREAPSARSPRRRIAFVVVAAIAMTASVADCSSGRDPGPTPSPSPSRSPASDASVAGASASACGPKSPGLLHVMNMYGVPLEIRRAEGNGPGLRIAVAPVGATDIKIDGPADQTARYEVVNPKSERPTLRLVSVSWSRRSASGPSSSRSIHMELRCAPTGGQ